MAQQQPASAGQRPDANLNPTPPPGNPLRLGRPRGPVSRRYGDEVDEGREFVRLLMRQSVPLEAIIVNARTPPPPILPMGRSAVVRHWQEVRAEMKEQMDAHLEEERALQAEQVRFDLGQMMQSPTRPWARIVAHRQLLADLTGTRTPLEVEVGIGAEVRVRSAMMRIVSRMSTDDFDALAERGRRIIDTTGSTTE